MSKIKQPYILIFLKNSIKNQYSGVFKNLRKHKQNMIFHVVAIRELFWKNYSIDLLFFGLPEERVRDVLREYKLVALQLYEYKEEKVKDYWKIKVLIKFEWQEYKLLSNATDIDWIAYWLSVIWFDIENINYVQNWIDQEVIDGILQTAKSEAEQRLKEQKQVVAKKEEEDARLLDEKKREKYQIEINKLLSNIQKLTERAKSVVPQEKLKTLFRQWQELSKLKMWRNFEKISSLLEKTYSNYSDLEQQYLSSLKASRIQVAGSNVSDTYVISEIQKLEKAKWLTNLWSTNVNDVFKASFWWLIMYLKFLKKDFAEKLKLFPTYTSKMFNDILLWLLMLETFSWFYFSLSKVFYYNNMNDYVYVMLVKFGVFWLVLYWINFIKKWSLVFNMVLLVVWILISILLVRILKQNFIF